MRDPAMGPPRKRITRMRYNAGPMGYLADQIMKEMQRAGYPAVEFNLYRSPEQQSKYYGSTSNAGPYQSAHQYYCASDIIHERWAWFAKRDGKGNPTGAPDGEAFWDCLWDCVALVSERFDVQFKPRLGWDAAHVELANWRDFKAIVGHREPSRADLDLWFARTLPSVWKAHVAAQKARKTPE